MWHLYNNPVYIFKSAYNHCFRYALILFKITEKFLEMTENCLKGRAFSPINAYNFTWNCCLLLEPPIHLAALVAKDNHNQGCRNEYSIFYKLSVYCLTIIFPEEKITDLINHCTLENLLVSLQTITSSSRPTFENTKDNYCHFLNY